MQITAIVEYWRCQRLTTIGWVHPEDQAVLTTMPHSFNLEYPISPYIGDIENAPVIILNANAGFHPVTTPAEFASSNAVREYVAQVVNPSSSSWNRIADYYLSRNYGKLIRLRRIAAINASPYRSVRISDEAQNKRAIASLPSTKFHRRWFHEAVLPLVSAGSRLVVAHRWGYWKLSKEAREIDGILLDLKCRAFPDIDADLLEQAVTFAEGRP